MQIWMSFSVNGPAHDPEIEISEKILDEFSRICQYGFTVASIRVYIVDLDLKLTPKSIKSLICQLSVVFASVLDRRNCFIYARLGQI